jgi:MarR family transcriptional regulator for hemolysin
MSDQSPPPAILAPQPQDEPRPSIGFLIVDVARMLRRDFNRRVQHLGLTEAQWRTLTGLERNQGANQVTLAELLEIQPITLARIIDRLVASGLVERRPQPGDRRAFRVFLTERARPLMATLHEIGAETKALAMAGLSIEDLALMQSGLETMRSNLASPAAATRAERLEKNDG